MNVYMSHVLCLSVCILYAEGSQIEILSSGDGVMVSTKSHGVDIQGCSSIKFQLKACNDALIWLGDGSVDGSYELVIGDASNQRTSFRNCGSCIAGGTSYPSPKVLDCDNYVDLWLEWSDYHVAFGKSDTKGVGVIFNHTTVSLRQFSTMKVAGSNTTAARFLFGKANDAIFELKSSGYKYQGQRLNNGNTGLAATACGILCLNDKACGKFSHDGIGQCDLFGRATYGLYGETQWKSWNEKFC
ncbi:uncharacterized protein LOC124286212 isoform X1 [Haliotis rubra]|uniref:uncharacterized protein LOC124286212 isoform X1 n=1 Tax=Haliotis rubra TaxID=36100 RepID=UPI001EE5B1FD|nr:uncharacterized protein LOC124286212 isoform X1 [Haliotis rubra]